MAGDTATAPVEGQPSKPADLTPDQKRQQREEAARKRAEQRKRKRAREATGATGGATPDVSPTAAPAAPAAASEAAQPVDPETLRRALSVWVKLLHRVAGLCCALVGATLDPLSPTEVTAQAECWEPWALHFAWFRQVVMWCAAPVMFLDLCATKYRRKDQPKETKG